MATRHVWAAAAAAAYVATAVLVAGDISETEQQLFAFLNDGADVSLLRIPQQLGTPWGPPVVAAALLVFGRRRAALKAAATLPVLKSVEVATKKLIDRPRPVYVQPTELRDDAPVEGSSFPSGHTALAVTTTLLVAPHVARPAAATLGITAAVVAYVRVHQGAHHPTDTLGGAFLGAAIGSVLTDRN